MNMNIHDENHYFVDKKKKINLNKIQKSTSGGENYPFG